MNEQSILKPQKKILAAIASIAMPGLGQIYNGSLLKGLCFFTLFVMAPAVGLFLTSYFPDRGLIFGVMGTFFISLIMYLYTIAEAFKKASAEANGSSKKSYNQWYFYCTMWVIGSLFICSLVFKFTSDHVIQFCSIPSASMEPGVQKGDFVIVDKTAYKRFSPRQGDIIVFTFPDDRSQMYIKRIAGLPGDTVRIDSVHSSIVPHGCAFVLGDNAAKAKDSRAFGPIPLRDILGKARQIYFSMGTDGVRWNRIGKTL